MNSDRNLRKRYRQLLKHQAEHPARPLSQILPQLLARRSYAKLVSRQHLDLLWRNVADRQLAAASRPGELRRGVLTIWVTDSAVVQELTFQREQILAKIQTLAPEAGIRDVVFRVDPAAVGSGDA